MFALDKLRSLNSTTAQFGTGVGGGVEESECRRAKSGFLEENVPEQCVAVR